MDFLLDGILFLSGKLRRLQVLEDEEKAFPGHYCQLGYFRCADSNERKVVLFCQGVSYSVATVKRVCRDVKVPCWIFHPGSMYEQLDRS